MVNLLSPQLFYFNPVVFLFLQTAFLQAFLGRTQEVGSSASLRYYPTESGVKDSNSVFRLSFHNTYCY